MSASLAAAIVAPERTVRTRLSVDWDGDGHGRPGTIDDLTGKTTTVTVTSVLQGTQPEQANVVEGSSTATLTANLAKGEADDERLQAVRYFSPAAGDSPLAGKPRQARSLRCDIEFLTEAGWEAVPLLRGITRGLSARVATREARLDGIDMRGQMRVPVTLPSLAADVPWYNNSAAPTKPGLESTWVASYALYQAGYSVAPPPSAYCRYYNPLHGSAAAFLGQPYLGSPVASILEPPLSNPRPVEFVLGPFCLATAPCASAVDQVTIADAPTTGAAMFGSDARSAGRVQLWATSAGTSSPTWPVITAGNFASTYDAAATFTPTGMILGLHNGATRTTVTGPGWPQDGAWHHLGVQWDDAAGRVDFYVDGAVTTAAFTPTPAGAGADVWTVGLRSGRSMAEVHVETGVPFGAPWLPDTYAAPAVLDRLQNKLDGIVPGDAVEAWRLLQEVTAAEQGAVYVDADGRPNVRSRAQLVSSAAQTVQRTVTADADLLDLAYDVSLDRVYNVVTGAYEAIAVSTQVAAWVLTDTVQVVSGQTVTLYATYTGLATSQRRVAGHANATADGTGTSVTVATSGGDPQVPVTITYTSGTAATVTVTNRKTATVWLVNTAGQPDLALIGDTITQMPGPAPVVVVDQASVSQYGPQPLPPSSNRWVQRREFGWGMALCTAADLAQPRPVFTDLPVPGDPRLQQFDRLTVADPDNSGFGMDVWYVGGTHTINAAGSYVQQLVARPARQRFLAGTGLVGIDLAG